MTTTTFDPREFRNALGCYATGVAVITARTEADTDVGVTVNSFSSLSLDPPLILFSVARTANVLTTFQKTAHFAVNILSEDQRALSNMFAKPSTADFTRVSYRRGSNGAVLFDGALAHLECVNFQQVDGGDHVIFVGQVESMAVLTPRNPLLFYRGAYGTYERNEISPPPAATRVVSTTEQVIRI
jgi:3-hydroxy-9,10-secoandrosta-1,3,5(10)-triene-9,17-dione monooxygenase reductase component